MKTLSFWVVACLLSLVSHVHAQVDIGLYGGLSSPFSQFSQANTFASSGLSFGGELSYVPKKWGLGIQAGVIQNPINADDYQSSLGFDTRLIGDDSKWNTRYALLGPIYQWQKSKLNLRFSPRIGFANTQIPDYSLVYTTTTSQDLDIINEANNGDWESGLISSLGLQVGYQISPRLGLFARADYLSNRFFKQKNLNYVVRDITDANNDGNISEPEIIASPVLERLSALEIDQVNTQLGLQLTLGKRKNNNIVINPSPIILPNPIDGNGTDDCLSIEVLSPSNKIVLNVEHSKKPVFQWKVSGAKAVKTQFELFTFPKDGKEFKDFKKIYETTTDRQEMKWPESIPFGAKEKGSSTQYMWQVSLLTEDAKVCQKTAFSNIIVNNPPMGVVPVSMTAKCAGTDNGKTCYEVTETWVITNDFPNSPASLNSHKVWSEDGNNVTVNYSNLNYNSSFPNSIAGSGNVQTVTANYEICVPANQEYLSSSLAYLVPNEAAGFGMGSQKIKLTTCSCDPCEQWKEIKVDNYSAKPLVVNNSDYDIIQITDALTAVPHNGNAVQQVNAEIVNYYYKAMDGCQSCNILDRQHGTFVAYEAKGYRGNYIDGFPQKGAANYTKSAGLVNANTSKRPFSREVSWTASNASGVQISPSESQLTIGVPKFSNLECCEDKFVFCIRYTFSTYDAKTGQCYKCSELVCYEVVRNSKSVIYIK